MLKRINFIKSNEENFIIIPNNFTSSESSNETNQKWQTY